MIHHYLNNYFKAGKTPLIFMMQRGFAFENGAHSSLK